LTRGPAGIAGVASLMMASVAWPAAQAVLAITFHNLWGFQTGKAHWCMTCGFGSGESRVPGRIAGL